MHISFSSLSLLGIAAIGSLLWLDPSHLLGFLSSHGLPQTLHLIPISLPVFYLSLFTLRERERDEGQRDRQRKNLKEVPHHQRRARLGV